VTEPADRSGLRHARITGVDAARAVALVGMFAVHLLPLRDDAGAETFTGALASGRASALFAVLAGVGVALATGAATPPDGRRAHCAHGAALLVRGLLVGLVGLVLVEFGPPVAVILAYYGLLFAVAIPFLRLRAGPLAALAVVCGLLTPVLSHLLRADLPGGPGEQPGLDAIADPAGLLTTLTLTGYYPVLTWTTYLFAGMAVGRLDLRRTRTAALLLAGGAALAAGASAVSAALLGAGGAAALGSELGDRRAGTVPTESWWWLAVQAPHTGTTPDLAHTTGTALAVLGAALLVARFVPALARPAATVGAVPLTLYSGHAVVLALLAPIPAADRAATMIVLVAVSVAVGVALHLAGRRGPLEAVVAAAGRAAQRAVSPAAARTAGSAPPPP